MKSVKASKLRKLDYFRIIQIHQMHYAYLLLLILLCPVGVEAQSDTLKYVFLGHTYQWGTDGSRIDFRLEEVDWNEYDRIWLGGDICSETSLEKSTIDYLEGIFQISAPENHWALGNHDTRNGNRKWITEVTGRPSYYAYSKNGVATIVLDGNISPLDCDNLDRQFEMIQNVCDTISSGHLFILVHHGIYEGVPGVLDPDQYGHSKLKNWMANCHTPNADYLSAIYPMLVEVEERGIEVYHVMGDVGANAKEYHSTSSEGIDFFGSGINNSKYLIQSLPIEEKDKVLIFKHIVDSNEIVWEFVEVEDL